MELRQLRYFVAVGRHQHFTRAAEEVGVAQPALSQQVRLLERELGTLLLDRTTRRVRLTPAGDLFLRRAEQILADVSHALAELQELTGLMRGRVTVGVVPSLEESWLPGLLEGFHRRYPGLEIVVREEASTQLREGLQQGRIDVAVVLGGSNPAPGLTSLPLFTEDLVVAVAPDHHLAGQPRVLLRALRDEPWILLKPGAAIRQMVLEASAVAGFTPQIVCESGSVHMLRALTAARLGLTFLPRSIATTPGPEIATVEIGPPTLTRTIALAWRSEPSRPAVVAAFRSLAQVGSSSWAAEQRLARQRSLS